MTKLSISGTEFHINNRPTYAGREFEGHKVQGLLFNVRAVQATFDDANPATRKYWAYPDSATWDADRNTDEFCAALPSWRDHGVLAFTVNIQGGGPLYVPEIYQNYDNNGFTPDGELKPEYAARLEQVLARADELGMVAIVGLFYCVQAKRMSEDALWRAAANALSFLESTGRENVLIEIANEIEVVVRHTGYGMFLPGRVHEMVLRLREGQPAFLYSTSQGGMNAETGRCMPPPTLIDAVDFVLVHGNGNRAASLAAALDAIIAMPAYQANPKPIVINEDSPGMPNFEAAWTREVSWGYYDQGWAGQGPDPYEPYEPRPRFVDRPFDELTGFQTPPVNWSINSPYKKHFFGRVKEITGY
jgi:hypothetical protein